MRHLKHVLNIKRTPTRHPRAPIIWQGAGYKDLARIVEGRASNTLKRNPARSIATDDDEAVE